MNFEIKNNKNPFDDFAKIAGDLMNNNVLIVHDVYYRFTSLEFYYHHNDHQDCYSHQHPNQKTSGQWYLHGSGLDITFGGTNIYGGILIRGIKNLQEQTYINGPILCVQELFRNFGEVDDSEKINFYIQTIPWDRMGSLVEEQEFYHSRRVGLNPKIDTTPEARFFNGMYRFFIQPKITQKDKSNIANDILKQVKSEKNVNDLFGYKHFKLL